AVETAVTERRVRVRDEGKAAAERRWVGAKPPSGLVVWSAAHSAYGRVIAVGADDEARGKYGTARTDGVEGESTPVTSPFRLLGQVIDEDADLCWTRFRCFDAETESWVSTDPLGLDG